ncbi:S49 family peptidase [Campylobacter concisus]
MLAYAAGNMASGSYYTGVNADTIVANRALSSAPLASSCKGQTSENFSQNLGVSEQVVKAGEFKEAGTFMRSWSKQERESLQGLVNDAYMLFVSDVAEARNLDIKKKDEWANARVFLAHNALKMGLIDSLGSYIDAQNELAKMSLVDEPIWQEKPQLEKIMEKFTKQGINSLFGAFLRQNLDKKPAS